MREHPHRHRAPETLPSRPAIPNPNGPETAARARDAPRRTQPPPHTGPRGGGPPATPARNREAAQAAGLGVIPGEGWREPRNKRQGSGLGNDPGEGRTGPGKTRDHHWRRRAGRGRHLSHESPETRGGHRQDRRWSHRGTNSTPGEPALPFSGRLELLRAVEDALPAAEQAAPTPGPAGDQEGTRRSPRDQKYQARSIPQGDGRRNRG